MIEIVLNENGSVSNREILIGFTGENLDKTLHFTYPEQYQSYHKYVLVNNSVDGTFGVLPINDDMFVISTFLTSKKYGWELQVMFTEDELDLSAETVDISPKEGKHQKLFKKIWCGIDRGLYSGEAINAFEEDENVKIFYDKIVAMINNGGTSGGVSSWNDITDKPFYDTRVETTKIITFDGNFEDKEVLKPNDYQWFVRLSDDYVSAEKIIGKNIEYYNGNNGSTTTIQVTNDLITQGGSYQLIQGLLVLCEGDVGIGPINLTKGIWTICEMDGETPLTYASSLEVPVTEGQVKTLDEMYLPETTKYQSDWSVNDEASTSYIKNRTHYDARVETIKTITFDGTFEGKEVVKDDFDDVWFTKVSDEYFPPDKLIGKNISVCFDGGPMSMPIASHYIYEQEGFYNVSGYVVVCEKEVKIILRDQIGTFVILSKGIWFRADVDEKTSIPDVYASSLEVPELEGEVKTLDEIYIPSTIARVSDLENLGGTGGNIDVEFDEERNAIVLDLSGASVGGESASGSSEKWTYLINEELLEDTAYVGRDGFKFKELEVYLILPTAFSTTGALYLTSANSGTVYGEPRINVGAQNTFVGVIFMKLEVIDNKLWRGTYSNPPYFAMGNSANVSTAFGHKIVGNIIDKEYIEGMTLIHQSCSIPSGSTVIVRGR